MTTQQDAPFELINVAVKHKVKYSRDDSAHDYLGYEGPDWEVALLDARGWVGLDHITDVWIEKTTVENWRIK